MPDPEAEAKVQFQWAASHEQTGHRSTVQGRIEGLVTDP